MSEKTTKPDTLVDNLDELFLNKMTVRKLKDMCKARFLPCGGRKGDLIRLLLGSCGKEYLGITSAEQKEDPFDESTLDPVSEDELPEIPFSHHLYIPGWGRNYEEFNGRAIVTRPPQSNTEAPYIPYEVVFLVLSEVRRCDLASCGLVCKLWRKVSLDERLGWFQLYNISNEDTSEDILPVFFKEISIEDIKERQKNLDSNHCFTVKNYETQYSSFLEVHDQSSKLVGVIQIPDRYDDKDDFQLPVEFQYLDKKLWKVEASFTREIVMEKETLVWHMSAYINIPRFDSLVEAGKFRNDYRQKHFIFREVKFSASVLRRHMISKIHEPHIPRAPYALQKQPKGLNVRLYQYQLEAMSWMNYVEQNVGTQLTWTRLAAWSPAKSDVLFDLENEIFVTAKNIEPHLKKAKIRGGCLGDETGLGKTFTILGLILNHSLPNNKVGNRVALSQYLPSKLPRRLGLISKATLVNCPAHVARHWRDEITKYTKLKLTYITSYKEYTSYNCDDLLTSDVVIVSHQFLKNNKYIKQSENFTNITFSEPRHKYIPPLSRIRWYRIVIDEGHEILNESETFKPKKSQPIQSFASKYRWYCTSMPFLNDRVIARAIDWMIDVNSKEGNRDYYIDELFVEQLLHWGTLDLILKSLYWRNTKESIKEIECLIPPCKTEVKLIDWHYIEKALYDDADDNEGKEEACIDPLGMCGIFSHVTEYPIPSLEDVRKDMTESSRNKRQFHMVYADRRNQIYNDLKQQYNNAVDEEKEPLLYLVKAAEQELQSANSLLDKAKKRCALWESIEQLHITQEQYLRMGDNEMQEVCHILATQRSSVSDLRKKLSEENAILSGTKKELVQRLKILLLKKNFKRRYTLDDVILFAGSKAAHVIFYLEKLCSKSDAKVIVFSKYDTVLYRISKYLFLQGISNDVVTRMYLPLVQDKSIITFSKESKVIMLAPDIPTSRTNLTQATHIIFIDPLLSMSSQEARAIESRAISHAYRQGQDKVLTIIRILFKNSLEYDFYKMMYGEEAVTETVENLKETEEEEEVINPVLVEGKSERKRKLSIEDKNVTKKRRTKEILEDDTDIVEEEIPPIKKRKKYDNEKPKKRNIRRKKRSTNRRTEEDEEYQFVDYSDSADYEIFD